MAINDKKKEGPEAFPFGHAGPDPDLLKPGYGVFVKWADGTVYRGTVTRKLRKNYEIYINDNRWYFSSLYASVPAYALIPDRYPNAVSDEEVAATGNRTFETLN